MASSVQAGDKVTIASGAKWTTGASVPSWVIAKQWIVASVSGTTAILNKPVDGSNYAIQSPINVSYLTVVGSSSSGSGSSASTTSTLMATNVQLNRDGNTFTATWDWSHANDGTTEHYLVRWWVRRVKTGNDLEVEDAQVSTVNRRSEFTLSNSDVSSSDYVDKVWFHVRPISKTYTVNDKEYTHWTASYSTGVGITLQNTNLSTPTTPSAPTLEINGYNLTANVSNVEPNNGNYNHWMQFQLAANETWQAAEWPPVAVGLLTATYTWNGLSAGNKYKVRCRLIRTPLNFTITSSTSQSSSSLVYSDWSDYSEIVSTVPVAVSYFTSCRAATSTSVALTWSRTDTATKYNIQYATAEELGLDNENVMSPDISDYFTGNNAVHSVTINENTNFTTISGLTTGKVYYFRIQAENASGTSDWSAVSTVTLGTKPQAPTTWSSTTTAIEDEDVILYWVHNSKDDSKESSAQITYTIIRAGQNDVTDTVTIVNNSNNNDDDENSIRSYTISDGGVITLSTNTTITIGDGATIKWKVRTAGVTNEYGDWSTERQIDIYARPTVTLQLRTTPSASDTNTITAFPFYISATTTPAAQTPVGYHISIVANDPYETTDAIGNTIYISDDEEIYSSYFDVSTELLVHFTPGNINLVNNISYTIKCIVNMNSGLTAEDDHTFTVAWGVGSIALPNASIGVNYDDVSVYIHPYCEIEYGVPQQNIDLSVYRRDFDGGFVEIASGVDNTITVDTGLYVTNNTYVVDPHPALNYARYRIVATSRTTGAISYIDTPAFPINEKAIIIQWDEKWTDFIGTEVGEDREPHTKSLLRLPYNISVTDSYDQDVSLVKYIGRKRPVSYYGTQLGETSTWTVDVPKNDEDTLYALRRLAIWTGDVYVREPSGSGYWAKISLSFGQKYLDVTIPVSIAITRVEGGM